jgi:hypothetical protein
MSQLCVRNVSKILILQGFLYYKNKKVYHNKNKPTYSKKVIHKISAKLCSINIFLWITCTYMYIVLNHGTYMNFS